MYGVAAAHPKAVEAGLRVLAEGGDAVDAAVAVSVTLGVAEPFMSNLGGGGVSLHWRAREGKVDVFEFQSRCPVNVRADTFPCDAEGEHLGEDHDYGHRAVQVPALLQGLDAIHRAYGRLPWEQLFEDAVALAEAGFPAYPFYCRAQSNERFTKMVQVSPAFAAVHTDGGKPKALGSPIVQKDYAQTLRRIAQEGIWPFYEGDIGAAIIEEMEQGNGLMAWDDLKQSTVRRKDPYQSTFRGFDVYTYPLPAGGLLMIEILNVMEHVVPYPDTTDEVSYRLAFAKSMRAAYPDRFRYYGDPDFVAVPVEMLSSKEHAREIADRTIVADAHAHNTDAGSTTHFSIIDRDGNAVAQTQSLGSAFGSGIMIPGTGIILNNHTSRMDPRPGKPNSRAPGKGHLTGRSGALLFESGRLRCVVGSPGSYRIPTAVAQTILNRFDRRMLLQDAVSYPRMHIDIGPLQVEGDIASDMEHVLREADFEINRKMYPDHYFGGVHALERKDDDSLIGAADPRRAGTWYVGG